MAVTVRASKAGLIIVDRARLRKGWKATAPIWCDAAYTSQATLRRFRQGKPIQKDVFIAICKAVGVNWRDIVDRSDLPFTFSRELSSTLSQPIESKEMLSLVDELIFRETGQHLDSLQLIILEGAWKGKTYKEIACEYRYSINHLKYKGANLWQILARSLGEPIRKSNFRVAVERLWILRLSN